MELRDRLVGETVEHARELTSQAERLAHSEGRLLAAEARDALAPAIPSLSRGAAGVGLAALGAGVLALPLLRRISGHAVSCAIAGGAALGVGIALVQRASRELPSDLRERVRDIVREDATAAVDSATAPA